MNKEVPSDEYLICQVGEKEYAVKKDDSGLKPLLYREDMAAHLASVAGREVALPVKRDPASGKYYFVEESIYRSSLLVFVRRTTRVYS